MRIEAKFTAKDIVGDLREGMYEMPDGTTAGDALLQFYREAGREMNPELPNQIVFLVNYRRVQPESVLQDGDRLRILYKILGG
jgi:hypothetical protein